MLVGLSRQRGRRREQEAARAELEEVEEVARDDLLALGDDIRALDPDVELSGADARGRQPRAVPVCAADLQQIQDGIEPQAREVLTGGRMVPCWAAGPAHLPWAGGFFGGGCCAAGSSARCWAAGSLAASETRHTLDADFGGGNFSGPDLGDFGGGDFGDFGGGGDF